MIARASGAFLLASFAAFALPLDFANAADLPGGYTCQDLRAKVAEYGATLILASARSRGFSEKDIAHIRQMSGVMKLRGIITPRRIRKKPEP